MKKQFFAISLFLFFGCNSFDKTRVVAISADASGASDSLRSKRNRLDILLDYKIVVDTTIKMGDLNPDFSKLITKFKIDSTSNNILTIRMNSTSQSVDLNKFHLKRIDIHVFYNDMDKLESKIQEAENIATTQKKEFDVHKFIDSLRKIYPGEKLDTLILKIEHDNIKKGLIR